MSTNRKGVRSALFTLLEDALTIPQEVLDHRPETLSGKQPLVYVKSRGSAYVPVTYGAGQVTEALYFEIHGLVLYKDSTAAPPLTVEGSDDLLDDLDAELRDCIGDNLTNTAWQMMVQEGQSQVLRDEEIEGRTFKHEMRIVRVMP